MVKVGSTLSATPASVTGEPTPVRSWQWLRDNVTISGATAANYYVQAADEGARLSVRQIETNFVGVASATSAQTATVGAYDPGTLFESGEVGAWYDPSDSATVWQDAAGTTPAGVGDPVGLILDKSQGLTLGSELEDTANTVAGWTPAGSNTVELDGDAIKITYVDNSIGASLTMTAAGALTTNLTAGKTYRFSADVKVGAGDSVNATIVSATTNPSTPVTNTAFGTLSFYFVADGSNETFRPTNMGTGEVFWIKNISIRELPGNHATQATSTARPTLQTSGGLYYLDFDGVDDWMASQYGSTLSNVTRSIAYRAESTGNFICDDYDNPNRCAFYVPSGTSLRFGVYTTTGTVITGVGDWIVGEDEVAIAIARSTGILSLQGTGNSASGNSVDPPADIDGVKLGASANNLLPLNGRIYGFVDVDRVLTTAEIEATESYLATKSGVTLP